MTAAASSHEATIGERLSESPEFSLGELREVRGRDLALRFAAGALTSVIAGIVTLVWGAKVGGILLAFPAILAASLTLIEEEQDAADAREDSRGAMVGALALAAFAAVGALTFTRWSAGIVLLAATGVWALVALGGYGLAWYGRRP